MATCLVPVSCLFKLNITICDSTRQNTWFYLRRMPVPPSIGSPPTLFGIFCSVQLQMAIFDSEEERDWNRACCHCKHQNVYHLLYFVGCNIPAKFQEHCFIIGRDIIHFMSHHCTCTTRSPAQPMTSSVTKFA